MSEQQEEITVTRRKVEVTSKVGLRLNLDDEQRLIVTRMAPDSLFADSELALGMQILSINGLDTTDDMSAEEATGLIKRIKGNVTLVATTVPEEEEEEVTVPPEPVIVTRTKESTSSKIGLRLGVSAGTNKLIITKIGADSIFANSELQPGMTVLSINGLQLGDAGFSAEEATNLIKRVRGNLTFEAVQEETTGGMVPPHASVGGGSSVTGSLSGSVTGSVHSTGSGSAAGHRTTVTVHKSSPEQKVGLSLSQTAAGMVITRVDPRGLFGNRVPPSCRLISVNHVTVKRLPVPLVTNMIKRVAGELSLVVETDGPATTSATPPPDEEPEHVIAPVIEVVDTEYMMGHHSHGQDAFPEVIVAPRPSKQRPEQPFSASLHEPTIEARAYRESTRTRVGIRLKCRTNGHVLLEHVDPDGLFGRSRLQAGMRLQSVNGVHVTGKPHAQVVQMIGQTVGELQLVAMNQ